MAAHTRMSYHISALIYSPPATAWLGPDNGGTAGRADTMPPKSNAGRRNSRRGTW